MKTTQAKHLSPILTVHARTRTRQRGLKESDIELIIEFGSRFYAGHDCIAWLMDERAISRASREGINLRRLKNAACVVSSDWVIVTVGHFPRKPLHWN